MSQQNLADRTTLPVPPRASQVYEPHGSVPRQPPRVSVRQPAPASSRGPGRRGGRRRAPKRAPLLGNYLGYAATFVGAGLISGAIVHHPLDPARYTVIAVIGAAVFLCATILTEFIPTKQRPKASKVLSIVASSLALSFGIGMLSGGLQHFEDFPARGAMLIPFGLTLSFVAYVLRHEPARRRSIIGPTGVLVLVTAVLAFVGLRGIADGMATESGGEGGHSHGEEASENGDEHDEEAEVQEPSAEPLPSGSSEAANTEGGEHADDGHSH
ncbi:hypothetical protein [Streptomyces canus]|uniref:hypothetical protein n=1 Tax=Streptomyces canus TaxID=58343 RepID=UPI003821DB4E